MTPPLAMCWTCQDEPLVETFAIRRKEFVCMGCGRLYEYLEPRPAAETPELLERLKARDAEWAEISKGVLSGGVMLRSCRDAGGRCPTEPHIRHATPDELAAHEAAAARIGERLGIHLAPTT